MTTDEQRAETLRPPAATTPCIVEGCPWHASWTVEETLADYCPQHAHEWLMAERESS